MSAGKQGPMRPASVRITGWGMYAPERVLTNADLERLVDTSDEWIRTRTGIRERRVAAPHETTATLAAIAGKRAIAVAGLEPDDIDLILVATLTPDYWMPSTAALVKEAIGNTRAAAMDIMAACSGFVYAYATADAYVRSGMYRNVLVFGAELLTRFLDFTDRNTCILFGDGAGAVVVSASSEEGGGMSGLELTTDPDGAYMIWLPAGARAARPAPRPSDAASTSCAWRAGRPTATRPRRWPPRRSRPSSGQAGRPTRSTSSSPIRPTSASSSRWPRASTCPWTRCSSTSTATATRRPPRSASPSPRRSTPAASRSATASSSSPSAPASRAARWPSSGPRTRSTADVPLASYRWPRVRAPVDWDSVDPMPPRLMAALEGGPPVPLDDVVPGEPEHAHKEVRA